VKLQVGHIAHPVEAGVSPAATVPAADPTKP